MLTPLLLLLIHLHFQRHIVIPPFCISADFQHALFQSLGTPCNTAIHKYMNQKKVPQLYVATGASKWVLGIVWLAAPPPRRSATTWRSTP